MAEAVIPGVNMGRAEKAIPTTNLMTVESHITALLRIGLKPYYRANRAVDACEDKEALRALWGDLLSQLRPTCELARQLVTREGLDPENPELRELLALEEYAIRQQGAIYE